MQKQQCLIICLCAAFFSSGCIVASHPKIDLFKGMKTGRPYTVLGKVEIKHSPDGYVCGGDPIYQKKQALDELKRVGCAKYSEDAYIANMGSLFWPRNCETNAIINVKLIKSIDVRAPNCRRWVVYASGTAVKYLAGRRRISHSDNIETDEERAKKNLSSRLGIAWVFSQPTGVYFSKTEVTLSQYRSCVRARHCKKDTFRTKWNQSGKCNWGHTVRDNHPMNCVNWRGADAFCQWVGGRLPTEKEWYAEASNGGTRTYPWGNQKATCSKAIMDNGRIKGGAGDDSDGCGKNQTWPVCSKPLGNSVSGLCDMSGNVWEWSSASGVLLGGGWHNSQKKVRSSARSGLWPGPAGYIIGIRCVRTF